MMYRECNDIIIENVMDHISISYKCNAIVIWWNIANIGCHISDIITHDSIGLHPEILGVDEI